MSQETFTFLTMAIKQEEQRGMRISARLSSIIETATPPKRIFPFSVCCSLSFEHDSCGAPKNAHQEEGGKQQLIEKWKQLRRNLLKNNKFR